MKQLVLGNILLKMGKAYFVIGLGYGDEGKGSVVDFLTEKFNADMVARFNGGSQAAHHVVNDGKIHCFSQFGSGTFIPRTKTYLSSFMYIDPISLMVEEESLRQKGILDAYQRLFIDEDCAIITPFQKYVGRMRELVLRNSSCGMGVGETVRDSKILGDRQLRIRDLKDKQALEDKLDFLQEMKLDQAEQLLEESKDSKVKQYFEKIKRRGIIGDICEEYQNFVSKVNFVKDYRLNGTIIFEGAQGILLDVDYGFHPFITKTKTTFQNAEFLANDSASITRIGVLRGNSNRHGKGPFVSEDNSLTEFLQREHNGYNDWQGDFRVGWFDIIASRYALEVAGGVDFLALTNLDKLERLSPIKACVEYETDKGKRIFQIRKDELSKQDKKERTDLLMNCKAVYKEFKSLDNYLNFLESVDGLGTPIKIFSYGPTRGEKVMLS